MKFSIKEEIFNGRLGFYAYRLEDDGSLLACIGSADSFEKAEQKCREYKADRVINETILEI